MVTLGPIPPVPELACYGISWRMLVNDSNWDLVAYVG